MGMQVDMKASDDDEITDINVVPLIDVMLVLLVMLIISLPPQTHAVKLDMPRPQDRPPPVEEEPRVISVGVDFDGTYYWNDEMVTRTGLDARLTMAAGEFPQPELHIRPHRLAEYRYVAGVLASAQRRGLIRIGVVGGAGAS